MREKVIQLSKGQFNYSKPDIVLSEDNIIIQIEEGNNYRGSFTISNNDETEMKGIVYSSDVFLTFHDSCFIGSHNEIIYDIKGTEFSLGDDIHTTIEIVCDSGEVMIPMNIVIVEPYCNTSLGYLKDLYHFTSLAKENWQEALTLFKSQHFQRVFLRTDYNYRLLYDNLIKSADVESALEEFLVSVHKKLPIGIKVQKTNYEYVVDNEEPYVDRIIIEKDNWGYLELLANTSTPFIRLISNRLTTDNFKDNTYQVDFMIDTSILRAGNNYGLITLSSYRESVEIHVTCRVRSRLEQEREVSRRYCNSINGLIESYLDFRASNINLEQYIQQVEPILLYLYEESNHTKYIMYLIHVYWNSNRQDLAREKLETLRQTVDEWSDSSVLLYCAWLYLEAYICGEEERIESAIDELTVRYNNGYRDWRILWFLLYLDKRYDDNPLLKLALIREQVLLGINSPILYQEALAVYIKEPNLFHEMGQFEIQIFNFAIKYSQIPEELSLQYVFLASKQKEYHPIVYNNLVELYHIYGTKEVLFGICSMLVKGQRFGPKYYPWFLLGIQEQLRITQLPESYMYSIEEDKNVVLPALIHQYFVYNSNLSDSRKAYLYGSIIKQKADNDSLHRAYLKQIESFARQQITLQRINSNLALIYNYIFTADMITPEIGRSLASFLFVHELRCKNINIKGVSVTHKELMEDTYVPLIDGKAYISLYTENYKIILVDKEDKRYVLSSEYTLDNLIDTNRYIDICYSYCPEEPRILLHLSEKHQKYHKFNKDAASIGEKVLRIPNLREEFYKEQLMSLLEYYYENLMGDELEVYLNSIEIDIFGTNDRNKLIEYTLNRNMYERAYYFIRRYGYHGKNARKIAKLCSKIMSGELGICNIGLLELDPNEREFFVQLYFTSFLDGKYNADLLEYLVIHYKGSTKNMYQLWSIAKVHMIDTRVLEERLLGQILFAESYIEDIFEVFESYYEKGKDIRLMNGFLSYYSYRYLVHGRIINDRIFEIIQKELVVKEVKVCLLALLKYYSTKDGISKEEQKFIEYYIDRFIKEGLILPFFKDFKDKINLPRYMLEKTYVEYTANPDHKVTIFYRRDSDEQEEYIEEDMKNRYLGIHVKEFVVFYNEELQYYIMEESEGEKIITKSVPLQSDYMMEESMTSFNCINLMLLARELRDDKTLEESMRGHIRNKVLKKQLFRIK